MRNAAVRNAAVRNAAVRNAAVRSAWVRSASLRSASVNLGEDDGKSVRIVPPELLRARADWRALVVRMNLSPVVVKFRAVKTSAPAANRPAPNVSNRPRALSSAVSCSDPLTEPTSWRASQSATGTNSAHTTASARTTTAVPTSHWMPRGKFAQRLNIRKR